MIMKRDAKKTSKKNTVFIMVFVIIVLFSTYSYAIASTTFAVSDMKTKNSAITNLQTDIAELELEYVDMLDKVALHDIEKYNLYEVKHVGYANVEKNTYVAYNF